MRGQEGYPLLLASKQMLSEEGYSPPTGVVEIDANEGILSKQRRKEIDGVALLQGLLKWTRTRGTGRISPPAGVIETDAKGEAGEMSPPAGALETDANEEDTPPTVVAERGANACWRHRNRCK